MSPACCCGGPYEPAGGPPGNISGQILFPIQMTPAPLAVYAVSTFQPGLDIRYVMTRVDPPARSYQISVPPGNYTVVARLDSDPLSSAGHLVCRSISCGPVMTRAGYVTCHSADCQPVLVTVHVPSGQGVSGIDVGGWGSLQALDTLWGIDEFGAPGPITRTLLSPGVGPSPQPHLPARDLPAASSDALPTQFGLPSEADPNKMVGRLHLPAGWQQVGNPARAVDSASTVDFSNQTVRSPLTLNAEGVWLTVHTQYYWCPSMSAANAIATATFETRKGHADFKFDDPHSPIGQQPYSGYAFSGTVPWGSGGCLEFRFTVASDQVREADLPTFIAIVDQAE